jgi:hypothetical protein
MKNAQEAAGRVQIEKRHTTAAYSRAIEFKRLLNAIEGAFFGEPGTQIFGF